jgi:hypothetical protein
MLSVAAMVAWWVVVRDMKNAAGANATEAFTERREVEMRDLMDGLID